MRRFVFLAASPLESRMTVLPWIAMFLAAPAVSMPPLRRLGFALLVLALAAAAFAGQIGPAAALALGLLLLAAWAVFPRRPAWLRVAGHALFIALALGLSLHAMPGFHNPRVIGPVRLTPEALPFTMYLNWDKPLVGFWLLLALPWVHPRYPLRTVLCAGAAGCIGTSVVCLALAGASGMVGWAPKWPAAAGLWLLNNLILVTFAEEALFRGYVQGGLERLLQGRRHGPLLALFGAAALFGVAHLAGGWQWAAVAGVAGVGYGLAYRHGGLYAAMLAHFGLNVLHFFLFTYPMRSAGHLLIG
jgi:membrane protease YdiL (CAAX protease family)